MVRITLRRVLKYFLGFIAAFALVVVLMTLTSPGLSVISGWAGYLASTPGSTIKISNIRGIWSGKLTVESIGLSDAKGEWLEISNLTLNWSPFSFLTGTFNAENLHLQSIVIRRLAEASGTPDASSNSTDFSLPVDVILRELSVDKILIAKEIGGIADEMSLNGAVILLQGDQIARIKLDAISRSSKGELHLDVALNLAKDLLQVQSNIALARNNFLSHLLELKGFPAIDFSLKGSGPLSRWQGNLNLAIDDRPILNGLASVAGEGEGLRIKGRLAGELATIMPSGLAALFAGNTTIEWDIGRAADGELTVHAARSASYSAQIEVSGKIAPGNQIENLVVELDTGGKDRVGFSLGDSIVGPVSVRANLDGKWASLRGVFSAKVDYLESSAVEFQTLSLQGNFDNANVSAQSANYSLSATLANLQSTNQSAQPLLAGVLNLKSNGRYADGQLEVDELRLQNQVVGFLASGNFNPQSNTLDVAMNAVVRVGSPTHPLAFLGQGDAKLKAQISRTSANEWQFSGVNVQAPAAALSGTGEISGEVISAKFDGNIVDLSGLSPDLSGGVQFEGQMSGPVDAPEFSLLANGEKVSIQNQLISNLRASMNGVASLRTPSIKVQMDADYQNQPLVIRANLTTSPDGERAIDDIDIRIASTSLAGSLNLNQFMMPTGAVELKIPDLSELAPFLGKSPISGQIAGNIQLVARGKSFDTRVKLNAASVSVGTANISTAAIDMAIADVLGQLAMQGRVASPQISVSGTLIQNLVVSAVNDGAATSFKVSANVDGSPVSAKGNISPRSTGGIDLILAQLAGSYQKIDLSLAAPSTVSYFNGTTQISNTTLKVAGGSIAIAGQVGKSLDLTMKFSSIGLGLVNKFAPGTGLAGIASGSVIVKGTPANPVVPFNVTISGLSARQLKQASVPPLSIAASGQFANRHVALKSAKITGSGLKLIMSGTVNTAAPVVLGLKLKGRVPFTLIEKQLAAGGMRLTGGANVDIAVNGPATSPAITGSIKADGTFVETASKLTINNLKAVALLSPGVVQLQSLSGKFAKGGGVSAKGKIGIKPGSGFPADIDLLLKNARYEDGEIVSAKLGGNVKISGKLLVLPLISGTINIAEANITIPQSFSGSVASLGLSHKNASKKIQKQSAKLNPKSKKRQNNNGGAALDLSISAPRKIFVRGRGLDAELGGSIRLKGTTSSPQAIGGFKLINGKLDILTRRVEFDYGTIGFSGALDPDLDFKASTPVSDATVSVNVTGRASNPKISFSSSPQLPEDEIVARFVFGESLQNLSVLQVAQMASAISTLSGKGGVGLVEKLRKSVGVDNLDVTNDEKSGVTVTAEKYVTEKLKVGVKKGTKSGSGKVTIDFDILKNLKARGELGQEGSSKGGLFFEREY